MKNRIKIISIVLIVLLILGLMVSDLNQYRRISKDGNIYTFDDGNITFSWDAQKYKLKHFSQYPTLVLNERIEGEEAEFEYIHFRSGMPDELQSALMQVFADTHHWYKINSGTEMTANIDFINDKEYLYYDMTFGSLNFYHYGEAFILCDTDNIAVFSMHINRPKNKKNRIDRQIQNRVFIKEYEEVIKSIKFVK